MNAGSVRPDRPPKGRALRRRLPIGAAVLAALALLWLLGDALGLPSVGHWQGLAVAWLKRIPLWAYLAGFVVLPALGFPISAYYLTVGAVVDGLALALAVAWACMGANMALSYLLARSFRSAARRLAERRGLRIPTVGGSDEWKLILAIRASPLPWMLQSWLLALGGARFVPYMVVGLPVQALIGLGFVVLGASLLRGDARWALFGLSAAAAVWIGLVVLRRRLRPQVDANMESDTL